MIHDVLPHGIFSPTGDLSARVVDVVLEDEYVASFGVFDHLGGGSFVECCDMMFNLSPRRKEWDPNYQGVR